MDEALKLLKMTEQAKTDHKAGMAQTPLAERLFFYGNIPDSKKAELLMLATVVNERSA